MTAVQSVNPIATSIPTSNSSSTQNVTIKCNPPQPPESNDRCETCIDRIFTLGPAPCPVCRRTLRKAKFRKQTFEDTMVEREVDVRRRIAKSYNKRREDFKSLRAYNDYLEDVEEISTPQKM